MTQISPIFQKELDAFEDLESFDSFFSGLSAKEEKNEMTTCKFCPTPARYYGDICPECLPIFQAGERAGKNFVVKVVRQELYQSIARLDNIEIK